MERPAFPAEGLTVDPQPLPPAQGQCIICGHSNHLGVRLRFHRLLAPHGAAVGVCADTTVPGHLQGFDGLVHGGIICALLDDAMWWAVYARHGVITVTGDMQLRFRQPIPITSHLRLEGIATDGRRIYGAAGRILDVSGTVLAEASARFVHSASLTIQFGA